MRRLTDFEKEIARQIVDEFNKHSFISFLKLAKTPFLKHLKFTISEDNNTIQIYCSVEGLLNDRLVDKDEVESELIEAFHNVMRKHYELMFKIASLLNLLEKNDLIILDSTVFSTYNKSFGRQFQPEETTRGLLLNSNDSIISMFRKSLKGITPTPALEVYVKNGFRTEEQRQNDFNRKVGWFTLSIAVAGLVLTAIFSGLTLWYTKNHDAERERIEDERYILDNTSEDRKDTKDELFKDAVMERVDDIATELELKNGQKKKQ